LVRPGGLGSWGEKKGRAAAARVAFDYGASRLR